jgi:D-beta-D-heptose 7-phosphate kinase/D-beta-D-heptose 1-phosphate adenosyltransferase
MMTGHGGDPANDRAKPGDPALYDPSFLGGLIERLDRARVLVLGDVMLDRYVVGQVERMSPEAPIPVLKSDALGANRAMPGGAGNVARNIAALGGRAILIGVIGADGAGETLRGLLAAQSGVTARLIVDPARPTTEKIRFMAERQQLLRVDTESAQAPSGEMARRLRDEMADALGLVDVVVLSDYAKGVLGPDLLGAAIQAAREARKPIIADPKSADFARYGGVDVLTPNRQELASASRREIKDEEDLVQAARNVAKLSGVAAILVTRGSEGMTLVPAEGMVRHFRAEPREVFDVSGAGDSVVAVLAAAIAAGADLPAAACLANLAGGIAVGKSGTALVHAADLLGALHAQAVMATEAKVVALETALERARRWRASNERIGFTNGCFDLIHPGHVALLAQARAASDRLIVGLNSDASVRRLKGAGRPIQNETARAIVLASLQPVDLVVVFDADTPIDLIRALKPDVLIKGADYLADEVVGGDFVQSYGGRVLLVDLVPGHSTSGTIAKLTG